MSTDQKAGEKTRELSSIQFPYADLESAISVADAILQSGGVPCTRDQLAAVMGQEPNSGAFGIKLAAARMFGLVDNVQGKNQLTPLGFAITDEAQSRQARAEAFLRVPLYERVYSTFKGKQLPPRPLGLEQAFVEFGVSAKQKDKARIVFERSAQQAGFFPGGKNDRLVMPLIGDAPIAAAPERTEMVNPLAPGLAPGSLASLSPSKKQRHYLIEGLLEELPDAKTEWAVEDQAKWLEAAAKIFSMLYKRPATDKGDIRVTLTEPK